MKLVTGRASHASRGCFWCSTARTAAARRPRRPAGGLASRAGHDVVTCRDPGGTALGERAAKHIARADSVPISLRAEMLLYMASRAQLVEEVIAPALAAGRTWSSDRYLLANIVYQGSAGGLLEEEIALVGMVATGGLLPDLTLVLDIAPDAALGPRRRRAATGSRTGPSFIDERVRAGYLAAAQAARRRARPTSRVGPSVPSIPRRLS